MATHEIWLTTDSGVRIALLDDFLALTATREVNRIAPLVLMLPPGFDESYLQEDYMVQVWRAPAGGALSLWRPYFIRRWRWETTAGGTETLKVWGRDCNDLLRRRIVAAYAASAQAEKTTMEADDMMKEIVTESIADGVAPTPDAGTRVWSDLSIAGDLTAGPQLTKGFAFKQLLTASGGGVLPAIAKAAKEAGTEVFFDMVPDTVTPSSITFEFRTYTGQPGQDVSSDVIFAQEFGNLKQPYLEYDYSDEANYIYAGGQGDESDRNVQQVYDAARYNASKWNRCEAFQDARNQEADNAVREMGRARLSDGRPRIRAGGVPVDTEGTQFGEDWDFGDKVTERYRNLQFDAIIRMVSLTVDSKGRESIKARLEYES